MKHKKFDCPIRAKQAIAGGITEAHCFAQTGTLYIRVPKRYLFSSV
ncbi:hypothetical protein GWR56_09240 [Mucilaginibacter sp. 14171R-50]|nr:hypothetical protein [Mucilaginibacter sp. 14171R-50]QHS55713.1 hypothetical protein GWR56_09240 [Mucilaginibacter sp. 14171R-50]